MATVMIIDDEESLARVIAAALDAAGHRTATARDGLEALKQFESVRPDVVVTDILMPFADGIETIREMKRRAPGTKIVAMSGGAHRGMDFLHAAGELGADRTIQKPFRPKELVALVTALLEPPAGG